MSISNSGLQLADDDDNAFKIDIQKNTLVVFVTRK